MESVIIASTGCLVGFLQAIIIYILIGIKKDQADIWKRINGHYHEADCSNDLCHHLTTGNVIIPRG